MIQDESGALTLKDHGICLSRYALFYQGRNRVQEKKKKSLKGTRLQKSTETNVGVDQPVPCEFNYLIPAHF